MLSKTYIILVILFPLYISLCKGDGFDNFLSLKMREYPAWLEQNNLDPSPLDPEPTSFYFENQIVKLHCSVFNHGVANFSEDPVGLTHSGALEVGSVEMNFTNAPGILFSGEYIANGTLYSGVPFSGQGQWSIDSHYIRTLVQLGYQISPKGVFDNLSVRATAGSMSIEAVIQFDGLWDDGPAREYGEYIRRGILTAFQEDILNPNHPFVSSMQTYWVKVLNETTVEDIIRMK